MFNRRTRRSASTIRHAYGMAPVVHRHSVVMALPVAVAYAGYPHMHYGGYFHYGIDCWAGYRETWIDEIGWMEDDIFDVWRMWQRDISSLRLSHAEQRARLSAAIQRLGLPVSRDAERIIDRIVDTTRQMGADEYGHVEGMAETREESQGRRSGRREESRGRRSGGRDTQAMGDTGRRLDRVLDMSDEDSSSDSGRDVRRRRRLEGPADQRRLEGPADQRQLSASSQQYHSQQQQSPPLQAGPSMMQNQSSQAPMMPLLTDGSNGQISQHGGGYQPSDMRTTMTSTTTTSTTSAHQSGYGEHGQQGMGMSRPYEQWTPSGSGQQYPQQYGQQALPAPGQQYGQQALPAPGQQYGQQALLPAGQQYMQAQGQQYNQQALQTPGQEYGQQMLQAPGQQGQLAFASQQDMQDQFTSMPREQKQKSKSGSSKSKSSSSRRDRQPDFDYAPVAGPSTVPMQSHNTQSQELVPAKKESKGKGKKKLGWTRGK